MAEAHTLLADQSLRQRPASLQSANPGRDQEHLRRLAWQCEEFSPLVGLEEVERPGSLLMEITGCGAYFQGEENLCRGLFDRMRQAGFFPRIGVADTLGAAWAVAHFVRSPQAHTIIPPGRQQQALQSLPLEALRLSTQVLHKLHTLEIRTINPLLQLPRQDLPSRFGVELLQRLDQALGTVDELIVPERRREPLLESWQNDVRVPAMQVLEQIVPRLLRRLAERLQARGEGFACVAGRFRGESGTVAELTVKLIRPSADVRHLLELLQLQSQRIRMPEELIGLDLDVTESRPLTRTTHSLWTQSSLATDSERLQLIERLSSRLGLEAVVVPMLRAEEQPELSFQYVAAIPIAEPSTRDTSFCADLSCLARPLWLKRQPTPVEVTLTAPQGLPARLAWAGTVWPIAWAWGPERITTGWWRGPQVRRDYYQVELLDGRRLWLFCDWSRRQWFLHATFD